MYKLSLAIAFLLGANAVSTESKTHVATKVANIHDASISFLSAISNLPPPDAAKDNIVLNYWKDD